MKASLDYRLWQRNFQLLESFLNLVKSCGVVFLFYWNASAFILFKNEPYNWYRHFLKNFFKSVSITCTYFGHIILISLFNMNIHHCNTKYVTEKKEKHNSYF